MADKTLHAQLVEATGPILAGQLLTQQIVSGPRAALRKVVELHAPTRHGLGWLTCPGCEPGSHPIDAPDWPCWTIRTIAHELGITEEGDS